MKAFVVVGVAIILTLIVVQAIADNCLTCCGGYACNPDIYVNQIKR